MLFVTPSGVGVEVLSAPKRYKVRIDAPTKRLIRARGYYALQVRGLPLDEIADTFGVSARTVSEDLAHYRDEKAKYDRANPIRLF